MRTVEQIEKEILTLMEERKAALTEMATKRYCITVNGFIPQVTELLLIHDPQSNKYMDIGGNGYWDAEEVSGTPLEALNDYKNYIQSQVDRWAGTMEHINKLIEENLR